MKAARSGQLFFLWTIAIKNAMFSLSNNEGIANLLTADWYLYNSSHQYV